MTEILSAPLWGETSKLSLNVAHVAPIPAPREVCWKACGLPPSQEQAWSRQRAAGGQISKACSPESQKLCSALPAGLWAWG